MVEPNLEPIVIKGIKVYHGDIPEELKFQFEKVEPPYSVNQGARGPLHAYDLNSPHTSWGLDSELKAKDAAKRDSESERLRNKAFDMALEQIAKKASEENPDIVAIAKPRVLASRTKVSEDPSGYRGIVTLEVEADAYKSRELNNSLDYVRRIEDFEARMAYVLGLDNSLFDDLEIFRKGRDEFIPALKSRFRFKDSKQDYAAIVVGAKVPHYETINEEFTAGYEGMVFQLCKGPSTNDQNQLYVIGIIVAQSVGEPLDISDLIQSGNFQKEIEYMKKVFKKMGLAELSDQVSVCLDLCHF